MVPIVLTSPVVPDIKKLLNDNGLIPVPIVLTSPVVPDEIAKNVGHELKYSSHRTDFSGRSRLISLHRGGGACLSSHRTDFSGRSRPLPLESLL